MTIHYNRTAIRPKRRELRQKATLAEIRLWKFLRNGSLLGVKFRRQYSVDSYIIDFYSPVNKLAIELDGNIHLAKEVKGNDEIRQQYLERFGITFLRIKNEMVFNDINEVLRLIEKELKNKRNS
jgi:very-short-patch-repair endonuclease